MQETAGAVSGDLLHVSGDRLVTVVTTFRAPRMLAPLNTRNPILRVELDSHADTCVLGRNVLIVNEHTRVVNVSGFDPSQPSRQAKIVDCVVKYI